MPTREEIREGLAQWVLLIRQYLCDTEFCPEPFTKPIDPKVLTIEFPQKLLKFLGNNNVVIAVEGELPKNPNKAVKVDIDKYPNKIWDVAHSYGWRDGWICGRNDTIEAGYRLTIPLVEE